MLQARERAVHETEDHRRIVLGDRLEDLRRERFELLRRRHATAPFTARARSYFRRHHR